jgi:hypothetical protein
MRRAIVGALFVVAVVVLVVVLRNGLPTEKPAVAVPGPESVTRTKVTGPEWRQVPLPPDTDQAHRAAADLVHGVFPVLGADGVRRLLSRSAAADTEVAHGSGGPLTVALDGARVVVSEEASGRTNVSTVDLAKGARTASADGFEAGTVAAAAGMVAVQEGDTCVTLLDVATLNPRLHQCTEPGWFMSLLTAEENTLQWRETTPDSPCNVWFRVDAKGIPQRLDTGERACRSASLIRLAGWEVTPDFPAYEMGVLYPGPLIASRGGRQIELDSTVLDVHACGGHVYWLSKPVNSSQQGELTRWTPGDTRVEVLGVGESGAASQPRCVNGVLNVVTYGAGSPQLWILPNP